MKANPTRIRWFTLRTIDRKMLGKLADGLLAAKFNEGTSYGFIIGDVRKDKVTGRYIQKETITRTITDPNGESQSVQFVDFTSTKFTLSTSPPNLEVVNPPRRLSEFLTALGDILDNKVAIVPVEATCRQWLEALSASGCTFRSKKIVTGNIAISDTVSVKASFSGTKNVQKEALSFLKGKKCDPVEIAGEIECDGETSKLRITANGVLSYPSAPADDILAAIRKACAIISKSHQVS